MLCKVILHIIKLTKANVCCEKIRLMRKDSAGMSKGNKLVINVYLKEKGCRKKESEREILQQKRWSNQRLALVFEQHTVVMSVPHSG